MNNLKNDILRINTMINNDRVAMNDSFNELFNNDLNKVISDYFELDNSIKVAVEKQGNKLFVQIIFSANSIKGFRNINT